MTVSWDWEDEIGRLGLERAFWAKQIASGMTHGRSKQASFMEWKKNGEWIRLTRQAGARY